MLRFITATCASAIALAASGAAAQSVAVTGTSQLQDQPAPPGGRCVPPYFNTIEYGPGDVSSSGLTNLGPIAETASHCVTSLPPTDIVDGQFTIAFRAGDTITGTFDGTVANSATAGQFTVDKTYVVTGGTGRFAGATGTLDLDGLIAFVNGLSNYNGTIAGTLVTTATTESGNFATATGDGSAAMGAYSSAYGGLAIANAERATAVGSQAEATGLASVAVGDQTLASGLRSTALGAQAQATGIAASALGHNTVASGLASTAVGVSAHATQVGATAVGRLATADFAGSTAIGAGAATTAANQVTLGATGSSVRIGDIAASTAAQTGTVSIATVDANGTLGRNTTLAPAVAALQATAASQATMLDNLGSDVDTLFDLRESDRKDFKRGVAAAVAIGHAAFPSAPGKTSYVLNAATFRGEVAVGGSLMHRLDGETPVAIGLGFSFAGKKNNAFRAGVAGEF